MFTFAIILYKERARKRFARTNKNEQKKRECKYSGILGKHTFWMADWKCIERVFHMWVFIESSSFYVSLNVYLHEEIAKHAT